MLTRRIFLIAGLLLAGSCQEAQQPEEGGMVSSPIDSPSGELADRVMEAVGGHHNWEITRFIRFTFAGNRTHFWDKHTGRHRLEGKTQAGESYVVLHNIQSREGSAYLDGSPQEGESRQQWLENAYEAWINDTYWLAMPFKMKDSGVSLEHAGEEVFEGATCDKVQLSFEKVGLTPGDRYWVFINRETGLIERWDYILESMEPEGPPTRWKWMDWQSYGPLRFSGRRVNMETGRELTLTDIAVYDALPDPIFTSPEAVKL